MPDKLFPSSILGLPGFRIKRDIRDPLYGYISVTGFENMLLDSPEFQRLDRIFQMPTARLVYPSGCYTRKSHSLGAMCLAHKALLHLIYRQSNEMRSKITALYMDKPIDIGEALDPALDRFDQDFGNPWWDAKSFVERIQCLRFAALLHDLGHAPFCHLFEAVCKELKKDDSSFNFDHEVMGSKIVEERLASRFRNPFSYEDVKKILAKVSPVPLFMHELIDGPYDCDKLDYLQRDSYHTGTKEYGSIDYERVINGFRVKEQKLLVSRSAIGALMNSFNAVQFMYTNVYYHKTSRIFDFMITDALLKIPDFIKGIASEVREFVKYDDTNFVATIRRARSRVGNDNFGEAKKILEDVLKRRKNYSLIFTHPVTLRIATDCEEELIELKKELEQTSGDLRIRVDYMPEIRPVGIELKELLKWLTKENIYDEETSSMKTLEDVNKSYFRSLTRYQIIFSIYGDRQQLESGNFDVQKNRLKELAETRLEYLEGLEEL